MTAHRVAIEADLLTENEICVPLRDEVVDCDATVEVAAELAYKVPLPGLWSHFGELRSLKSLRTSSTPMLAIPLNREGP